MSDATPMPKEEGLDHTLELKREGYRFISNRRERLGTDVFETRLLGQQTICMVGEEAARIFYDDTRFKREGAAPRRVKKTLFGQGGVQGLDDEAHRNRKAMFMSLMGPDSLQELRELTRQGWDETSKSWEQREEIILFEEMKKLLFRVACQWAGVPCEEEKIEKRTRNIARLFQSASAIGPQHWLGRMARGDLEDWIEGLVEAVRDREMNVPIGKALHEFSLSRDHDGILLPKEVVAVEILNIIRPLVAVSIYGTFLAHALHKYPGEREKLSGSDDEARERFVQEVRRFYPFFPFAAALVRQDFHWKGYDFAEDTLTLLDLYGTNHDPKIWENPERFDPDRFIRWDESAFSLIPQGGGDHFLGHRCAGEWATIEVMKLSLHFLVERLDYEVPDQDLTYAMDEIPARPRSGMVLRDITRVTIH